MKVNERIYSLVISALLVAIGIIIPMYMPIKVVMEPMSFTLASHVAIMLAMLISPSVALATALGTTFGFFLSGFPLAVVLRALSHVIWALVGSLWLKKHPQTLSKWSSNALFVILIALLHAVCEVVIVLPLYVGTDIDFLYVIFGLVGIGTIIHSSVDFVITQIVYKALCKIKPLQSIANVKNVL